MLNRLTSLRFSAQAVCSSPCHFGGLWLALLQSLVFLNWWAPDWTQCSRHNRKRGERSFSWTSCLHSYSYSLGWGSSNYQQDLVVLWVKSLKETVQVFLTLKNCCRKWRAATNELPPSTATNELPPSTVLPVDTWILIAQTPSKLKRSNQIGYQAGSLQCPDMSQRTLQIWNLADFCHILSA